MGYARTGGRRSASGVHSHYEVRYGIARKARKAYRRFCDAALCWSYDQRPQDCSQGQRSNQNKTVLRAAKGTIYYEENWLPFIRPLDTFTTVTNADRGG